MNINLNKITIAGWSYTGTSSVAKALAKKLNYYFLSTGEKMRDWAEKEGFAREEVGAFLKKHADDPVSKDIQMDKWTMTLNDEPTSFVLDSRLGWYFLKNPLKVILTASLHRRALRCLDRDGKRLKLQNIEDASSYLQKRDTADRERYVRLYPDIPQEGLLAQEKGNIFHIEVDTSNNLVHHSVEIITDTIIREFIGFKNPQKLQKV